MTRLSLHVFRIPVHLGCLDEERKSPQFVSFTLTVLFPTLPKGALTDRLDDTVSYSLFCEVISKISASKHFYLIEHLGYEVYTALREKIDTAIGLEVIALKEKVPLDGVVGGASFQIRDWEK